jgi:hypothetical protein
MPVLTAAAAARCLQTQPARAAQRKHAVIPPIPQQTNSLKASAKIPHSHSPQCMRHHESSKTQQGWLCPQLVAHSSRAHAC